GEAISWHLREAIGVNQKPVRRVVFHEITPDAVKEAFAQPRDLDMKLVDAQQARRILDRLVGYKISPLLWKKVKRGLSAGRVQSVAVRMIVDREREVKAFVPVEYWTIEAELSKRPPASTVQFRAALIGLLDAKGKLDISNEQETNRLKGILQKAEYSVHKVQQKKSNRQPAPPFITSTLQQEAWRKLKFTAKRTMAVAQQLYEGLALGREGNVGLITYMRTDSTRIAVSAQQEARDYIAQKFGTDFLPPTPRAPRGKVKGAQEAHEAIRPTSVRREPDALKQFLNRDQLRLYELVWKRLVASQMADAVMNTTTIDIAASTRGASGDYLLRTAKSVVSFPGFLVLYTEDKDDAEDDKQEKQTLPDLAKGEGLNLLKLLSEQHFTEPPPRYTEATLVKALEQNGIGRPSTYAPIISTIQDRGYVEKDNGRFKPLELGFVVNDLLVGHFPKIVDIAFTARLEDDLDKVANGKAKWVPLLKAFYVPFEKTLIQAAKEMPKVRLAGEPTNEVCPNCGKPMVIKTGRFGRFMSCSGYPECKTHKPLPEDEAKLAKPTGEVCEKCGKPMVMKRGRFGNFLACSGYPECKNTKRIVISTGAHCPKCGGEIVQRSAKTGRKRVFYGCANYPKCDYISWQKPLPQACPSCGGLLVMSGKNAVKCAKCDYTGEAPDTEKEPAASATG
ncbi:MAG: type I DNA topoisomerase, partial [Dehalococcoidia bacterium]|nr:type I DNA topoisomerase [Dehalococcoidia bacterium]